MRGHARSFPRDWAMDKRGERDSGRATMCDEYDDERLVAFWRALDAAKAGKRVEDLEEDEPIVPTILAPPAEPAKRAAKPLHR